LVIIFLIFNFQPLIAISTRQLVDLLRTATMILTGHEITEALLLAVPDRPLTTPLEMVWKRFSRLYQFFFYFYWK